MPPFSRKKYQNWTNDQLLQHYIAEGDYCAFLVLYERYEKRLWGMFKKRVRNAEDCGDLIQLTYEKLLTSKGLQTNTIEKYEKYLLGIAFNTLNQYYRKKRPEDPYDFSETPPKTREAYTCKVGETSEKEEKEAMLSMLSEAIQELSPKQQVAINLQLQQLSYEEIAERMDTNETNVGSLLNRAKKKLEQIFKRYI